MSFLNTYSQCSVEKRLSRQIFNDQFIAILLLSEYASKRI